MSNARGDWVEDAKANWRELCGKRWDGELYLDRVLTMRRYECSESTVRKLHAIVSPLVEEENRRVKAEAESSR